MADNGIVNEERASLNDAGFPCESSLSQRTVKVLGDAAVAGEKLEPKAELPPLIATLGAAPFWQQVTTCMLATTGVARTSVQWTLQEFGGIDAVTPRLPALKSALRLRQYALFWAVVAANDGEDDHRIVAALMRIATRAGICAVAEVQRAELLQPLLAYTREEGVVVRRCTAGLHLVANTAQVRQFPYDEVMESSVRVSTDAQADRILAWLATLVPVRAAPLDHYLARDPEMTNTEQLKQRRERALAEREALGGLRSPRMSVAGRPQALVVGGRMTKLIVARVTDDHLGLLDTLGNVMPQVLRDLSMLVRKDLGGMFGTAVTDNGPQASLLSALVAATGDPEAEVPRWLTGQTPLGMERPIVPVGVFPLEEDHAVCSEALEAATPWSAGNYASYEEHQAAADANLREEHRMGRLVLLPTRQALEAKVGPTELSRIGVVAKVKGGRTKIRLIHDLKRSGVNKRVRVAERLVLPRIADACTDALDLLRETGDARLDVLGLDFKDAFKQVPIDPSEWRHLTGRALDGYFHYVVLLFGVRSGPLIWGRIAALIMRLTAALVYAVPARLQCFVDDPLLLLAGTERTRRTTAITVILFWMAMGFDLNWGKGSYGPKAEWIGAILQPWTSPTKQSGIAATMPLEKLQKLCRLVDELLKSPSVDRMALRQFTGLVSWIASLIPQLNPRWPLHRSRTGFIRGK